MMNKKAQAALEFIMTYGWAILVVLVAVGALAYFGVLSPDRFLPSKCTLSAGLACVDHKVANDAVTASGGKIQFRITNSLGYDIDTILVKVGECGDSAKTTACCAADTALVSSPNPLTLPNGESGNFIVVCDQDGAGAGGIVVIPGGNKINQDFNVSYRVINTGISHNNAGELTSKVE